MLPILNESEARVIGCLLEKAVTTPDQYPLTLNALTNACNQKSGRNPAMSLQQGAVQHAIRDLQERHLVRVDENFKSRAEKYVQRFCNTRFSDFQFDEAQYAVICLLLLRGPQTPGELKARCGRLHTFADNSAVVQTLLSLANFDNHPLVVKLPRTPGRKDSEYMHLFSGPIEAALEHFQESEPVASKAAVKPEPADLEQRVKKLEIELAELKKRLGETD